MNKKIHQMMKKNIQMTNNVKIKKSKDNYLAFISYRHADNRENDREWASWLHTQLEAYEVPADLIGTSNIRNDTIPERIYPIFRDELSLSADANLEKSIVRALENSHFLVVLCSPRAVESRYVNDEILYFKKIGRSNRIIAVILDGEPNSSLNDTKIKEGMQECFPEALRYELDENAKLDYDRPTAPIAADFRLTDGSQGFTNPGVYQRKLENSGLSVGEARQRAESYEEFLNNARLKIIAGILGVSSLEKLTERDKVHQLAKAKVAAKRFRRIATVMAILAITATAASFYAYNQFQRAESTLTDLRKNLNFMNVDLRMLVTYYLPDKKRIPVIKQVDHIVASLQQNSNENDTDNRQFAIALKNKADQLMTSDLTKALDLYRQALKKHRQQVKTNPNDNKSLHDLSVILIAIGDFHLDRSEFDFALEYFTEAIDIRQQLIEKEPEKIRWQRELAASHNRKAIVLQKLDNFEEAIFELQVSLKSAERIAQLDSSNIQLIRDLYIAWNLIGNTQQEAGKLNEALGAFLKGISINKKAYIFDYHNIVIKRDLSVSYTNIGDLLFETNNTAKAIEYYQDAIVLAEELCAINPKNPVLNTDLASNHVGLGRALEISSPDASLEHFYKARDLIDSVITRDQLDDDRHELPDIISKAISRLQTMSR